jgi:DNA-directed RNA polymerase specialized sigma24 family protein
MKTVLTTDWAPHAEAIARRLAQICTVVYVAGYITGAWIHRLNDRLAGRTAPPPAPAPVITQRQAAAATPANIAPPVLVHISDPMIRAIRLVRVEGRSQRLAASICGVSRSSLQRALKA